MLLLFFPGVKPALAVADPFEPGQIALGPDGNIYALVSGNDSTVNHIFVFAPGGGLVKAIDARATYIAFDASGNLYMFDSSLSHENTGMTFSKMDINGSVTRLWNFQNNNSYLVVGSIAVSPDGKLYINEFYATPPYATPLGQELNGSLIVMIDHNGTQQVVYAENYSNQGFHSMAVDADGTIYAAGPGNTIEIIAPDGNVSTIGKSSNGDDGFSMITSVALGKDGYLYVTEYGNHRVQKLTTGGAFVTKWKGAGIDPFLYPFSPAADANGKVYVSDPHNERIVWLTPEYAFGDDTAGNLKGEGVTWGNVFTGTNYTTRLQEFGNQSAAASSLSPVIGPFTAVLGILLAGTALYMLRKRL